MVFEQCTRGSVPKPSWPHKISCMNGWPPIPITKHSSGTEVLVWSSSIVIGEPNRELNHQLTWAVGNFRLSLRSILKSRIQRYFKSIYWVQNSRAVPLLLYCLSFRAGKSLIHFLYCWLVISVPQHLVLGLCIRIFCRYVLHKFSASHTLKESRIEQDWQGRRADIWLW